MLANAVSGAVLLALSVGYYLAAAAMPSSILDTTVSSAAFPKMLAIGGGLPSIALIVQSVILWQRSSASSEAAAERETINWTQHGRAIGLLAIVIVFVLLLEFLGYPVAVGMLILAVSLYQGHPLSFTSVAVAVGGAILFWLFFVALLGIRMPMGLWDQLAAAFSTSFA